VTPRVIGPTTALNDLFDECLGLLGDDEPHERCSEAVRVTLALHRRSIAWKYEADVEATVLRSATGLTMAVVPRSPGVATTPHAPGTWTVMAMLVGDEEVAVYEHDDGRLRERRRFHIDQGIVAALPDDAMYATGNAGASYSIELRLHGRALEEIDGGVR
jgi:hypothetical protein